MEAPEVHAPHTHHGGGLPRWLELLIAVTALITSISSIAIAVHHGHIMERLVQANSLPYLQAGFSDATLEGNEVLSLDLLNRGVGPAHEYSLRVKVGDTYVRSQAEFVAASVGAEQAAKAGSLFHFVHNRERTRFIPGGQKQFIFFLTKTPENAQWWDLLAKDLDRWDLELCYCSVFNECWQVRNKYADPEPVKQCLRDESREFSP